MRNTVSIAVVESGAGTRDSTTAPERLTARVSLAEDRADPHLALAEHGDEALAPLDGLGQVAALDQRPAADQLLGLGERSVDDRELAVLEA